MKIQTPKEKTFREASLNGQRRLGEKLTMLAVTFPEKWGEILEEIQREFQKVEQHEDINAAIKQAKSLTSRAWGYPEDGFSKPDDEEDLDYSHRLHGVTPENLHELRGTGAVFNGTYWQLPENFSMKGFEKWQRPSEAKK